MSDELFLESARSLSSRMKRNEISALELTEGYLERIKKKAPTSFLTLLEEEATRQAKRLDEDRAAGKWCGPLHGIPVGIKDNIAVEGVIIRAGSGAFSRYCPEDAEVVNMLRKAGAVIVGTANMHELGHGVTGENRHYGTPLNPWGEDLLPGGSSSGSSTAVSAGLCGMALGSDTAGSVRIPASLCGNLSLKPTGLSLPGRGLVLLCPYLDTVGLHARSAADLGLGWGVLSGMEQKFESFSFRDLDLGLYLPREVVEYPVLEAIEELAETLRGEGARVYETYFDFMSLQRCGHTMIFYNATLLYSELLQKEGLGKDIAICLREGLNITAEQYRESLEECHLLTQPLLNYFKQYSSGGTADLLLLPVIPLEKVEKERRKVVLEGPEIPVAMALTRFTYPASLAGLPALTFPLYSRGNFPVGLQVVAPRGQEGKLLYFAQLLEQLGLGFRKPPLA